MSICHKHKNRFIFCECQVVMTKTFSGHVTDLCQVVILKTTQTMSTCHYKNRMTLNDSSHKRL